jgi:hypothetical protein
MTDQYDLLITNPARQGSSPEAGQAYLTRGLLQLGLALDAARSHLGEARACGANAYLVPVAYRDARVTLPAARLIALRLHTDLQREGRRLAPLDEGFDDARWWTFFAEDLQAIEEDRYPGRISISIDKLDGRVRSKEELDAWLRLSAP